MGKKKELAKAFKQLTAKAVTEQIEDPGLFDNKAVECEHFVECLRDPVDADVTEGRTAKLIDMQDEVAVFIGTRCVGRVLPGYTAELRERYKLPGRASRSITGKVIEVSDLSPTFLVLIGK